MEHKTRAERIAILNDRLRESPASAHGKWLIAGELKARIENLPTDDKLALVLKIIEAVGKAEFNADVDPHGERDLGTFDLEGVKTYWKIDYYNHDLSAGSEDPTDPAQTHRVLSVFYATDY